MRQYLSLSKYIMKKELPKNLKEQILARISEEKTRMRPRWHFVLKSFLAVVGFLIVVTTLIYMISLGAFFLRQSGVLFAPQFGIRGVRIFFVSLPWFLIVFSLVFIVVLEILVRKYSFGYRRPLLYTLVAVLCIVIGGGVVVARTPFHGTMLMRAERHELPFGEAWYRGYGKPRLREVHPGVISEMSAEGFRMVSPREEILTVIVTPQTRFPLGLDFSEGDAVVVMGERDFSTTTIRAFGVRIIDPSFIPQAPPNESRKQRGFRFIEMK